MDYVGKRNLEKKYFTPSKRIMRTLIIVLVLFLALASFGTLYALLAQMKGVARQRGLSFSTKTIPEAYLCCSNSATWQCVTGNEPSAIGKLARPKYLLRSSDVSKKDSSDHRPLRIGFVSYATGPYNAFAEDLWESMQKFAFPGEEVHFFLFTDRAEEKNFMNYPRVHKRLQERLGWPFDSLGRHFLYLNASEWFVDMDYMLAIDSDAKVVARLDESILGSRIATLQAWSFGRDKSTYNYESRMTPARAPYSSAYISSSERRCYFCGGLFGGTLEGFIRILEETVALARRDLAMNPPRVAIWHDESYLNRIFIDSPPTVVLSPAFMYPEPPADEWLIMQGSEQGAAAWRVPGGSGRRFQHKIYNLGVRKHRLKNLNEFQPIGATLPAIMSSSGKSMLFPLPLSNSYILPLLTFVVKAFERPTCLRRLLRSISTVYPTYAVIVLDDSSSPILNQEEISSYNLLLTYLRAEPDVGLSLGRNSLVNAVKTPYVLLLDDDFVMHEERFSESSPGGKLASLVSALIDGEFDIVGGCVDSTQGSAWSYSLAREGPTREHEGGWMKLMADVPCSLAETPPRPPDYTTEDASCWRVDMILNFFLARTSFLREVQWDPELKLGEHEDFFLRVKDSGGKVAMCRGFTANNDNTCDAVPAYKAKRQRVFDFWVHMFKKHSLTQMTTPAGIYTLKCEDDKNEICKIDVNQDNVWFN
jgi:glycosyltransferase involved in cell wall biosynthesis